MQSFEAFERFIKDSLFDIIQRNELIEKYAISLLPKNQQSTITREKMPGGKNLFSILKKVSGSTFNEFTNSNNLNIKYSELWIILSEVRHSITHKDSLIEVELINKTKHHFEIFEFLFDSSRVSSGFISIELDYKKFNKLTKRFSEFAFQIFKMLSIAEEHEWRI